MPIKLPKGFPRRKSSGNVLDDFPNSNNQETAASPDSGSSFKVLARPNSQGKSLDGGRTLRASPGAAKQLPKKRSSFEEDSEDLFSVVRHDVTNRSSGGTNNSLATAPYDSAASSTRYSNSSTNPSSVDSGSGRNVKAHVANAPQATYDDIPAPPTHSKAGFLKNAGRTFSFGINKHNHRESQEQPPPLPHQSSYESRGRAMTVSSVTTATAPRLDDSSFSLKSNDDDFGNMFANVGSNPSREDIAAARPQPLRSAQRAAPPDPIRVNRQVPVESSPYSWHSQNSGDGLIGSPSPSHTVVRASPQLSNQRNATMETIRSEDSNEHNMFDSSTMHHSPEIAAARIRNTNSPRAPPSAFPTSSMARVRAQSNGASSIQRSDAGSDLEQPPFDPSLLANAQLATQYEERISSPTQMQASSSKVMTPAQFERYKQQKEDTRRYNKVFGKADSDDGSGDDYDDDEDDQQEREKSAAKQRKKQEAHLAVYRQQMRKVTGDMPSPEPRPGTSTGTQLPTNASQNDLSLNRRMSQLTVDTSIQPNYAMSKPPIDDEPEEDEDVPLGILAAHGFPNKNKPPTRLAASNSNPNLRNLAQVQGGASVVGDATNRGSLPAFARHLPVDPYYGASLVHQSERTALNMSQTQLAAQPQPSGAATAHPLHPAGLVGVIAGEERARAMRRGSPNTQGGYDMPPGAQQGMRTGAPAFIPGFPQPGMQMPQPMLTPSEHAQLQMSQSMTQMMQMQMQWMQQMSSMMGQNPNMQMAQMPPMPMQGMANMQTQQQHPGMPHRPQSVPLQMATGGQQRSMSTLHPGMGQAWHSSSPAVPQLNLGSVYAPSIAPSERSNVGLAPRYRPVSTAPQQPEPQRPDWNKRASTFSSATFRPWTNENGPMKSAMSTVRVIPQANDDEDDEQGWAEMKAKKDKKQKGWKLRKGGNQLQELYNTPA